MRNNHSLILASTSPYKRKLFDQLNVEYKAVEPSYEEERDVLLPPGEYAEFLAYMKTKSLADRYRDCLITASDQVLVSGSEYLYKPGSFDEAFRQLKKMTERDNVFYTGLALYLPEERMILRSSVSCRIVFRKLTDKQIIHYLKKDRPYQCAGSFKIEEGGVLLFEEVDTSDFYSLIGFPLIEFSKMMSYYPHYDLLSLA